MNDLVRATRLAGLRWWRFAGVVVLGVVALLAGLGLLALSAVLICRAAEQPPILSLGTLIVSVRALALLRPGARYTERLAAHDLAFRSLGRLRTTVFAHLEPLAPAGLEAFRDGELLSRLVADIDELQDLVLRVLLPVAVAVPTALLVVVATALVSVPAALALAVGLTAGAVVPAAIAHRRATRSRGRQAEVRAALTAELLEVVEAGPELWLCEADGATAARAGELDRELVAIARRDAGGAGAAEAAGLAISGGTTLIVLALVVAAAGAGSLEPLLVAPISLVALVAFDAVLPLAATGQHLPSVRSAARRVLELVDRRPPVQDPSHPRPLVDVGAGAGLVGGAGAGVDDAGQVEGERAAGEPPPIDVRGAGMVVARGGTDRVLDGVDLDLPAHRRLVVRGPSGVGKSTLLLLLARFLERDGGRLDLAGHDVVEYAQDDVRRRVLLLDQDPHVFDSDVRENVALARPGASDVELAAALDRAQLGEWLAGLPEGLDTRVGEAGRALSGGQRHRLAMARAFLADPSVLLLDEPTAHLDAVTAAALLADLDDLAEGRSVVLVTHVDAGPFTADAVLELHPTAIASTHSDAPTSSDAPDHRPSP